MSLPINLPPRVVPGQPVSAFWANSLRESIARLARRKAIRRSGSSATAAAALVPWQPTFFTEGTGEATVYKCRFHLGTLNQNVSTNWNDAFTLSMAGDDFHFVTLAVTTASGKVTALTLAVESSPPTEDSIAKDTPPVSFKIVLGAIGRTAAKMIITTNLEAVAAEVFRESKSAPATGAEPFSRWWRWNVEAL